MDFATFALSQLPPPPARVLEIGCGQDGGIIPALADAEYDAQAVDPRAPQGARYRQVDFQSLGDERYDAIVAERVLHHVHPLGASLDKLARLAPLLVLDEFAWDLIDEPTREWYEAQHRALRASGVEPNGPPDIAEWRHRWVDLHPSGALLRELRARFAERSYAVRPYLYRWLGGPVTAELERALIAGGAIQPIGFRWVGVTR